MREPDPADLPPQPSDLGEHPPTLVAVPTQARTVLREAGLDLGVLDRALARARREEVTAQLIWCARVWAEGHPRVDQAPDDETERQVKERDLLLAVREYEQEVVGDDEEVGASEPPC